MLFQVPINSAAAGAFGSAAGAAVSVDPLASPGADTLQFAIQQTLAFQNHAVGKDVLPSVQTAAKNVSNNGNKK